MLLLAGKTDDCRFAIALDGKAFHGCECDFANFPAERGAGLNQARKIGLITAGKRVLHDSDGCHLPQDWLTGAPGLHARLVNERDDLSDFHDSLPE
jgi:hypothetical protein